MPFTNNNHVGSVLRDHNPQVFHLLTAPYIEVIQSFILFYLLFYFIYFFGP